MDSDPKNIGSLVSLLDEQINGTETSIVSLQTLARQLVPNEIYDDLSKEQDKTEDETVHADKEAVIKELEKARIELVVSLQQQDFIGSKLEAMIADSESLVNSVMEHCSANERVTGAEEAAFEERMSGYKKAVEDVTLKDLDENLQKSTVALKHLQSDALRAFENILSNHDKASSTEYKHQLTEVINTLNATFESLVKR
ncbi:hypothetical protein ACI3LY_003732 [Candidozyma auris]|uniref:Uncharacterized protein n=2 Tax=Candidozyma auris TaxID=498019 RepID=A0AB36W8C0_CANAR|nr:hypothetical protein QG37_00608 [[Candida] auris]PIS56259.1 hypothetical protein CJI97_001506 [[Candida] auris]PIS56563.1 hypothetical protein B9J08_001100 [[Candida] auris]QWW24150.1 hypothetical protein CA7LBN_002984 [[Candida] auris]